MASSTSLLSTQPVIEDEDYHLIPIELIETYLDTYLSKLVMEETPHNLLYEMKVKWAEMFAFASEFQHLVEQWEKESTQKVRLFTIPISVRNKVQSLIDKGEVGNLRALFTYMKGRVDGVKSTT